MRNRRLRTGHVVLATCFAVAALPAVAQLDGAEWCSTGDAVDRDGDGTLSVAEMAAFHEWAIPAWDRDADEALSTEEFVACFAEDDWFADALDGTMSPQSAEAAFDIWDVDGDGLLTRDDLLHGIAVAALDADGDGEIRAVELIEALDMGEGAVPPEAVVP